MGLRVQQLWKGERRQGKSLDYVESCCKLCKLYLLYSDQDQLSLAEARTTHRLDSELREERFHAVW